MGNRDKKMGTDHMTRIRLICIRCIGVVGLALFMVINPLTVNAQTADPGLTLTPCHIKGVEDLAQCGTLQVPENRSKPLGRMIALNIDILPPSGGQPTKEPLYLQAGGPGQAATEQVNCLI